MTLISAFSLFTVMLVLAAMPGSSVVIVITRSTACGLKHGVLAASGIVCGDILFILIAILGLAYIAESFSELFIWLRIWLRFIAVVYLLWLAVSMWRAAGNKIDVTADVQCSKLSSYLSGLLFTLADQKALLFYLGLFPAFLDLSELTLVDIGFVILIAVIAVGGMKVAYALLANRALVLLGDAKLQLINKFAAGLLTVCAVYILISV